MLDPRTQMPRYLGITFRGKRRYNEHLSRAVTGGKTHRDCWIRSLISQGLRPGWTVIEFGTGDSWQNRERDLIAEYRLSADLVNHTDGGEGSPGYIPSPELRAKWSQMRKGVKYAPGRRSAMLGKRHSFESREKIRESSTGRHHTTESKAKLALAHTGKILSAEHIKKLASAKRGCTLSPEHKAKIAASTTGRKIVVCVETGQHYASVTQAARAMGVNEASVNQAIRKGCRCKGNQLRFA